MFDANLPTGEVLLAADLDAKAIDPIEGEVVGHLPRFSPDGQQLAYAREQARDDEVSDAWILDRTTGVERTLGPGGCPSWTMDGEALIAFRPEGLTRLGLDGTSSVIEGGRDHCALEVGGGTYVLWDQDDQLHHLVDGVQETLVQVDGCGIGPVDAIADRSAIAYTVVCDEGDDRAGLWTMDLEARKPVKVLDRVAYGAAWSPDGRWIATSVSTDLGDGVTRSDLWVADASCECDPVTITEGAVNAPTWGPPAPG